MLLTRNQYRPLLADLRTLTNFQRNTEHINSAHDNGDPFA